MDSYSNNNTQHSPHARVRVINIADYDAIVKTKEQKMSDDCLTPKKKPAKNIFKKAPAVFKRDEKKSTASPRTAKAIREAAGIRDILPIPPSPNDEALSDFLNRVSKTQSSPKKPLASSGPQQQSLKSNSEAPPESPKTPSAFAMLPEYARYQEARFHRVLSRGNSFSTMSPSSKSPGFEWVDHRTSSSRSLQNSWDANMLVSQHAFPSSIFCHRREEASSMQAAAMAAMHQEYGYHQQYHTSGYPSQAELREMAFHDYMSRRSFHESASLPSATALSRGSSSSWSEDEEQRHFMEYMSHGASPYAHQQQASRQQLLEESQEAPQMVEISPGVHEPLRKAEETVKAVRHDFYVPVSCFGCSEDIFCIADAKYVICPTCRVVSPIGAGALDGQELRQHGLGLGFTCETLFQIQSEIIQENR